MQSEVFFELKYTENGFGKAKNDNEHQEKYEAIYAPLIAQCGEFINVEHFHMQAFFDNYQLGRNLCHLGEHRRVLFVYPRENMDIYRKLQPIQQTMLTARGREHCQLLPIDTIVDTVLKNCTAQTKNVDKLRAHYEEFIEKYLA